MASHSQQTADAAENRARNPFVSTFSALKLSGSVISAVFNLPYEVAWNSSSSTWDLNHRNGSSALYDSFTYLNSQKNAWNHTLIGWTGEIKQNTDDSHSASSSHPKKALSASPESVSFTASQRRDLQEKFSSLQNGAVKPVWLATDPISDDVILVKNNDEKKLTIRNQDRWRRYPEGALSSLLHYKQPQNPSDKLSRQAWADYVKMNKAFASKIVESYHPGDIIIIHDYQLMLVPSILRQRLPNAYIGFYLHAPFPSSELFRCLPRRKEILEGMLGSNMIGFQTYSYSRHFSSCCTRILGYESSSAGVDARGAHVAVDVFPVGIDVEKLQLEAFNSQNVDSMVAQLRKMYAGKHLIIGRDRLDAARGIVKKMEAFEEFLERYPEWQEKVVLIQITSPNQTTTTEAASTEEDTWYFSRLSEVINRINGKFGSVSFTPVQHHPQYVPKEEYYALLRVANVCLVTSVRDGMNTTALEYILCQEKNEGALILSEFSGSASTLVAAYHPNPWDIIEVASAIHSCLTMSDQERTSKFKQLHQYVTSNTVQAWAEKYIKRLVTNLSSFEQSVVTPILDRASLQSRYLRSKKRLFMFDYDGTLTPIVKDPQAAVPSDKVVRTIKTLASDPANSVWIVSGRDQEFLDEWMGHIPELGFSAEHGSFLRFPGESEWHNLASQTDMSWQEAVDDVFQSYTERTQGAFIERKKIALTWHYRRADPEYGAFQAKACQEELLSTVSTRWEVEVMAGKANLEVRPRFLNKGEVVRTLIKHYVDKGESPDLVLCMGDDTTDEDMFRSLLGSSLSKEHIFTCTIGASSKQTLAKYHLNDPQDVIATVAFLNELR